MTPTQTHAAQVLTDAETDQHLDAVLNGAGSALRHYTTEFSLSRMRAAMREHEAAILAKLQPAQAGELPDERQAFEREMRCEEEWGHRSLKRRADGGYENWQVALMWSVWQARAALAARKPLTWRTVIPGGKRTDEWDSARVADYNAGWNAYRKAAQMALEKICPLESISDDAVDAKCLTITGHLLSRRDRDRLVWRMAEEHHGINGLEVKT